MKPQIAVGLVSSALIVASCGGRQPVEINPNTQSVATRWNGTLSTPPELGGVVDIRGQAWMAPDEKDPGQTRAHVDVANAIPGSVYPWHVHRGQCGSDQGIFGPADAYKPLKIDNDGKSGATAVLPVAFPRTGTFFVNIHASRQNLKTTVGCGNLAPPAR